MVVGGSQISHFRKVTGKQGGKARTNYVVPLLVSVCSQLQDTLNMVTIQIIREWIISLVCCMLLENKNL